MKFANVDPVKEPIPVVPDLPLPDGRHPDQLPRRGGGAQSGIRTVVPGSTPRASAPACRCTARNRLGTNSLLDLLVFGKSARASSVIRILQRNGAARTCRRTRRAVARRAWRGWTAREAARACTRSAPIRARMQAHCGVFRFPDMLVEGVKKISEPQRACQDRGSRTRARCSTPRASRRSSSTT